MKDEPWVEDENHKTINGERWVVRNGNGCSGSPSPGCELWGTLDCLGCDIDSHVSCKGAERADGRNVRWYRANSPALAFFDKPKEELKPATDPVRPLSEICMDGIRSSLRTFFQDRDRRAVEIMRDIRAASLDKRVQAAMDAMLTVPDSFTDSEPYPAPEPIPEDDVEIIIDPTPEQVPEEGAWGCCWDSRCDNPSMGVLVPDDLRPTWKHYAVLTRGRLTNTELLSRVRQMLAEKEAEK